MTTYPEKDKPADTEESAPKEAYKKATTEEEHEKNKESVKKSHRSMMGAPVDPNSPTTKINFPPGVEPEDAIDPGRATPGAPPVDDRSGEREK